REHFLRGERCRREERQRGQREHERESESGRYDHWAILPIGGESEAGLIHGAQSIGRFRGPSRSPSRCASASPAATAPRPCAASRVTGAPRSQAPSAAAVTGLSARKAVTRVGVACCNAHSQREYPPPLPRPTNATASQPTGPQP